MHAQQEMVTDNERQAMERLIRIAESDTGQSRRVADFLLAWWNAAQCGGFDFTNLWSVDDTIAEDMVCVFQMIARVRLYPDALGYKSAFTTIIEAWRPELLQGNGPT